MIYIGFGANIPSHIGSPPDTLLWAFRRLSDVLQPQKMSPLYKTAPMYKTDQNWFYNAVASFKGDMSAHEVLDYLNALEEEAGRIRSIANGPRPLDLDILDYNGQVIEDARLTLPHSGLSERGFVLYPLRDIAPDWIHPESRDHIDDLIMALGGDVGIEKL